MASQRDGSPNKAPKDESALRDAVEADAREMLRASGKDPEDPEALKRLLSGAMEPMDRIMYTRAEAAELMLVSLRTYLRMHERGEGPAEIEFTPDVFRVTRRALDAYLTARDMAAAEKLKAKAKESAERMVVSAPARKARSVGAAIGQKVRKRRTARPSMYEPPAPTKKKATLRAVPPSTTKKRS